MLATDVKDLMVASEWRTDGPLAEAVVGWLDEVAQDLRSLVADDRAGGLERLAECFIDCSDEETFLQRSMCGLRCVGFAPESCPDCPQRHALAD